MQKQCNMCFGTGRIGSYGLCQQCDGDGKLYLSEVTNEYVSEDERNRIEEDDWWFWNDD